MKTSFKTIDKYIAQVPVDSQELLQKIRETIKKAAPDASEAISYQMPTFKLNGKNLVHFAAFKKHIGFYPISNGVDEFKEDLAKYKGAKGSVQFPLDKPIPYDLIARIVRFRVGAVQAASGFPKIGNVALRALHNAGYTRLEQLTNTSEKELLKLHGVGPKAISILKQALIENGLALKNAHPKEGK